MYLNFIVLTNNSKKFWLYSNGYYIRSIERYIATIIQYFNEKNQTTNNFKVETNFYS